jgi:hypothetical protein
MSDQWRPPVISNWKLEVIRRMKGLPNGVAGAEFPIRLDDMSVIGYMRTIDVSILDDTELIGTMAEARTKYRASFLTQFDVTPENKRNWLENGILKNDRRILFFVESDDHTVVGQDGFTIHSDNTFDLDGTMRWLRYGHRELYVRCGVERAALCFFLLDCGLSRTEVFSDNIANVKNSLKMGYSIAREHKLFLSERDGIFRYEKIEDADIPNTDRKLLTFEMTRESCKNHHPNIY